METIHYAGGSLLTGSDIAHAVLMYGRSLADKNSSDTVEIPTRNSDGTVGWAELLIGPASQLVAEESASEYDEIVDEDLVAHLTDSARALEAPRPMAVDDVDPSLFPDFGTI